MVGDPQPDNALPFKLLKEPGSFKLKREDLLGCEHRKLILDVEGRLIQCESCKKMLDPWRALKVIQRWFGERDYKWEAIKEWERKQQEKRRAKEDRRMANKKGPG